MMFRVVVFNTTFNNISNPNQHPTPSTNSLPTPQTTTSLLKLPPLSSNYHLSPQAIEN
jgi:hypothetical protein